MRADHPLPAAVDEVLAALPPGFVVGTDGDARLVVGPVGAFVLAPTPARGPAVGATGDRVRELAVRTRAELCHHLTWVPFVDALLVSASRLVRRDDVTVAPVDLLAVVLTEGPVVVDLASLAVLRTALRAGRLAGWSAPGDGPVTRGPAGRIDLCETTTPSTTAPSRR